LEEKMESNISSLVKKAIDEAMAIELPKLKEGQTLKVDIELVDEGLMVHCYPVDKGEEE
tara:strand:- start:432 stop:608 length:177 start_codon:yes stop_codon:yes gene_type:complete